MKLIHCQQGSETWAKARAGVITASKFKDALSTIAGKKKDGKEGPRLPSSKAELYAAQVAIERISETPCDENFNSWQMRRGQEIEPFARMAYESVSGNLAEESGVALTDDNLFGYSTDGFIDDDGCIEIKCLVGALAVLEMWRDQDLSEYIHQIQGGLWITGRKWCDFVMYCPQLESIDKQLFTRRVVRDEALIEKLEIDLLAFEKMVSANEAILRSGTDVALRIAA